MNRITVMGSINMDMSLKVPHLVKPGETLAALDMIENIGGKGANQAVAAVRSETAVRFVGAVGRDSNGQKILDYLKADGIDTDGIRSLTDSKTGQAFVMVDQDSENSIIIYPGSNHEIQSEWFQEGKEFEQDDFTICQLEVPLLVTADALKRAKAVGATTVLNPAPAPKDFPLEVLKNVDVLIPNEIEVGDLLHREIKSEEELLKAAKDLHLLGPELVIITLGKRGAFYHRGNGETGIVPAFEVKAVDTTAAGDTFIGALISKLKKDFSNVEESIKYGNLASSLAVQKPGAMQSIPTFAEIKVSRNFETLQNF